MNIKDLFDKAENGTLTYDQFTEAATKAKAKFVDLSEGGYVDKQKYTDEIESRDKQIGTLNTTISTRDADLKDLQEKLQSAGTDANALNELNTKLSNLQTKYDTDTQKYQDQLKKQAYEFAVKEFAGTKKFTSSAAKRDFINSMMAKDLQIENGTIIGATDFVKAYTKDNADAFVKEPTPKPAEPPKPQPHFAGPTVPGGNPGGAGVTGAFNFNFTGVRPHENK